MYSDNIEYLRQFIGTEWLDHEFERIDTKSPLRGSGIPFVSYHPWVHYVYECNYLAHRAIVEGLVEPVLGPYFHLLNYYGALLKDGISYIVDISEAKEKMRNPQQFHDFFWELETRSMTSNLGAPSSLIDPKCGNTYDGLMSISNHAIAFECKNKVLDNDIYSTNGIFARVITDKLGDVSSVRGRIIQVEYSNARLEDQRTIVNTIREKMDIFNYQSILGRYKVHVLPLPYSIPGDVLIRRDGVSLVCFVKDVPREELSSKESKNGVVRTKLIFKFPEQLRDLKNIDSVLKKANSQLKDGGIVFLQVPSSTFESAKFTVEEILKKECSHIWAVKIVALDIDFVTPDKVNASVREDIVISQAGESALSVQEIDSLTHKMAFQDLITNLNNAID